MLIEIDFNSDEAIYMQVRNQIIMGIATAEIREGDALPSVRQMAQAVGINMHTVNKAYSLLRQEGFIQLDRRKGAVVALDIDKIKAVEEMKQQEARRHAELMEAIREYVTVATAPFLSQKALDTLLTNIEQMACGRTDSCLPLRSNPDRPLRSPELRHLAWNIGERLHISLEERARFIKLSFPHELNNATVEYLQRNLRVAVPSHIPIDIPDEGDFRFHLELIGVHRKK